MIEPPAGSTVNFACSLLEGVPRYLVTLWEFLTLRPRRFFLKYEQDADSYLPPWPFLLVNAALAATFAVLAQQGFETSDSWSWPDFGGWLLAAVLPNLLVVAYGAVAAWLIVIRVSARAMMVAFCYASTFLPAHLPLTTYVMQRLEDDEPSPVAWAWLALVCLVQGAYLVSLLMSMARYNYIDGPHLRSFVLITLFLTLGTGIAGGVAIAYIDHLERRASEASVDWNISKDAETLLVSNGTLNRGCRECWATHAEAKVGEILSFEIFYHHSSAATARGTRTRLMLPSLMQGTGIVGAEVWSQNSSRRAAGAVAVTISSDVPVTLRFIGGEWYKGQNYRDQTMTSGPLPISSPSEIWSDAGMRVGDVLPGWKHQGNIIVRFEVVPAG